MCQRPPPGSCSVPDERAEGGREIERQEEVAKKIDGLTVCIENKAKTKDNNGRPVSLNSLYKGFWMKCLRVFQLGLTLLQAEPLSTFHAP